MRSGRYEQKHFCFKQTFNFFFRAFDKFSNVFQMGSVIMSSVTLENQVTVQFGKRPTFVCIK
jgi:hypothetical protein